MSGAIQKFDYLDIIKKSGFENISVQKEKVISLPDDILAGYLNNEEINEYREGKTGILSITVYGDKPKECCGPDCCN